MQVDQDKTNTGYVGEKCSKKECHEKIAELLEKAAKLQREAGSNCESNNEKYKCSAYESMGYLFEAMKHIKKSAKHAVGIKCGKCGEKNK